VITRADIVKHVNTLKVQLLEHRIRETTEPIKAASHLPSELQYRIQAGNEALQLFDELGIREVKP
jgi:hypothetical protein